MALRKIIFCILLYHLFLWAELPFSGTKESFEFGLGTTGRTPFSLFSKSNDSGLLFEVALMSLYDYGFRGESQLVIASAGGDYILKSTRVAIAFSYLEAFNLYKEIHPTFAVSQFIGKRGALSVSIEPEIASLYDDFAADFDFEFGGRYFLKNVYLASSARMADIGQSRTDQIISVECMAGICENRFGAQAVGLSIDLKTNATALKIAEVYRFSPFLRLSVAVQTKPLFVHVGLIFNRSSLEAGALFSRHQVLGWSKGGYVQYLVE